MIRCDQGKGGKHSDGSQLHGRQRNGQTRRAEMAEQRSQRAAGEIDQLVTELTPARQQAERWQAQAAEHRAELAGVRSELPPP